MRHHKVELVPKQKSLTIHIHTNHTGPHGMPLVYGSTPDRVGFIKGSVRFSSNYDCKGRDIQIIYEAWVETHGTANDKHSSHHPHKEVFGRKTFTFPLVHTKHNGSIIAAGVYEKEFEIPLIHPAADNARRSFESTSSTVMHFKSSPYLASPPASPKSSPTSSSTSLPLTSASSESLVLPSSNYSPNSRVRYTIRAVLRRPFPSLNYEASQEIWVVNSDSPRQPSEPSMHSSISCPPSPVSEGPFVVSAAVQEQSGESEPTVVTASPKVDTISNEMLPKIRSNSMTAKLSNNYFNKQRFVLYLCYLFILILSLTICKQLSS
ncbi:hypothetical protein BGX21_004958 [Mortierella sp. AD011]|nr:hypothetical protein BGX20_008730 [Mortierella sp. AD010]KAF9371946.1 hypothetical protein BGX21_004958 [Mortierella sp. AD011]